MDPVRAHIAALIETYTARREKYMNGVFYYQSEEDVAYGRLDELGDVIQDLKCVLDAKDVTSSDTITV
jgi:hypothetical protein